MLHRWTTYPIPTETIEVVLQGTVQIGSGLPEPSTTFNEEPGIREKIESISGPGRDAVGVPVSRSIASLPAGAADTTDDGRGTSTPSTEKLSTAMRHLARTPGSSGMVGALATAAYFGSSSLMVKVASAVPSRSPVRESDMPMKLSWPGV